MDSRSYLLVLLLCIIIAIVSSSSAAAQITLPGQDMQALLAFQAKADGNGVLNSSWNPANPNPCLSWHGIQCDVNDQVINVSLDGVGLTGMFAESTLSRLTALQVLDLSNNSFTGPFPADLSDLTTLARFSAYDSNFSGPFPNITTNVGLTELGLSHNHLTGPIPDLSGLNSLATMDLSDNSFENQIPTIPSSLTFLDLSNNNFSGGFPNFSLGDSSLSILDLSYNNLQDSIPDLSSLTGLKTLNLSNNSFGENIPSGFPSSLTSINLSNNLLYGPIPPALANFSATAFAGNIGLCGTPINLTCPSVGPAPESPTPNAVASMPSGDPGPSKHPLSTRDYAFIVVGALVLATIALCVGRYFWRRDGKIAARKSPEKTDDNGPVAMTTMEKSDKSKLSFFDNSHHGYDLEDLLRASAEMLGKGSFGTAYKAVMESGMIVAVKRLRDAKDMGKREFDQHMEMLGRLRHPNLVPLRAYYYAKEEKLLIYDFMPNGSLSSLLHGSRGPGRTPLEWPARISIAQGVAQGLNYLHQQGDSHKIFHGNIKSSNVLMGKNFEVCISDFGLVPLMQSNIAAQRMAGYRAPEYNYAKKISYKADVYSFGVLLLELLTGRQPAQSLTDNGLDLPKWVHSVVREEWTGEVFDLELKSYLHGEEEMVTLLQIAMSCVDPKPNQRPEMASVVEQLDAIRRGQSSMDTESYQSRSSGESREADYSREASDYSKDYSKDFSKEYSESQEMPSTS